MMFFLSRYKLTDAVLPNKQDWREKGIVSAVKYQGSCGSSCLLNERFRNVADVEGEKEGRLKSLMLLLKVDWLLLCFRTLTRSMSIHTLSRKWKELVDKAQAERA